MDDSTGPGWYGRLHAIRNFHQCCGYNLGLMPEREEVRVRLLPAGNFRHGFQCDLHGGLLRVEFATPDCMAGLEAGSLVEVESERTIYLGEVYGQEDARLLIGIEHAVDRQALAAIQDVWSRPSQR